MDAQVSYVRLLVGDNSPTAPVYSDAQIREAVTKAIDPVGPALPADLRMCGLLGFRRFPVGG